MGMVAKTTCAKKDKKGQEVEEGAAHARANHSTA